jgi:glycopeptide antibiotics resistance protein
MFGRGSGYEEHRCNLQPFREIERFIVYRDQMTRTSVMLNLFGNVLAFIPFGMLLRWARNKNTTLLHAFVYSLLFTVVIEICQYITKLGVLDVDDIILNTLGGVIGYAIYYISARASRRYYAKKQRI